EAECRGTSSNGRSRTVSGCRSIGRRSSGMSTRASRGCTLTSTRGERGRSASISRRLLRRSGGLPPAMGSPSIASPSCCRTRRPVSHHQEEAKMLSRPPLVVPLLALVVLAAALVGTAGASKPLGPSSPTLLYGGLSSGLGSTVGPGRALYVTDPVA